MAVHGVPEEGKLRLSQCFPFGHTTHQLLVHLHHQSLGGLIVYVPEGEDSRGCPSYEERLKQPLQFIPHHQPLFDLRRQPGLTSRQHHKLTPLKLKSQHLPGIQGFPLVEVHPRGQREFSIELSVGGQVDHVVVPSTDEPQHRGLRARIPNHKLRPGKE